MRIPIALMVICICLTVFVDIYIWFDVRRYTRRKLWSNIYGIGAILCWSTLAVLLMLPRRNGDSSILPIMWGLYAYCTIYIPKVLYILFSLLGRIPQLFRCKRINLGAFVGMPVAVVVFIAMWWGTLVTRNQLQITQVEISSPRLPASFAGYKIVQFSDAHVGTWGEDTSFIKKLVKTINEQNPDLIVFTGDIVNRKSDELVPFIKVFSMLKAKDGVISILGNHDYGDYIKWDNDSLKMQDRKKLVEMQAAMGWDLLRNRRMWIKNGNDSIMVIGVENWGEPPFPAYGNLELALSSSKDSLHNQNDNNFKLLLSHNPEHWNQHVSKETNIDLTLSGHTHAMQSEISIGSWKWSLAKYRYKLWEGLYEYKHENSKQPNYLYVNIGCGEVGIPARIGATPEITVITLKKN